jgi:hypothetical protein
MIPVHTNFQIPYTSNGTERGIEGEVRAVNGQLQVFNGADWIPVHVSGWVDDINLETVVEWCKQKMEQELREQALAEQFPAFAKAKENYDMIRMLVENELA